MKFEFTYFSDSGIQLDTGSQTVYKIFPAEKVKEVAIKDVTNSVASTMNVDIVKAAWANN